MYACIYVCMYVCMYVSAEVPGIIETNLTILAASNEGIPQGGLGCRHHGQHRCDPVVVLNACTHTHTHTHTYIYIYIYIYICVYEYV